MSKQDDNLRGSLVGGYKVPYDSRPMLEVLSERHDNDAAWEELWNELHHHPTLPCPRLSVYRRSIARPIGGSMGLPRRSRRPG